MIKFIIVFIVAIALGLSYFQLNAQFNHQLKIANAFISGKVSKVKSATEGVIKTIHFKKGESVKQGDLLFDFDNQAIDIQTHFLTQQLRQAIDAELKQCLDSRVAEREIALSQSRLEYLENRKKRLDELAKNRNLAQEDMISLDRDITQETLSLAILKARLNALNLSQQLPLNQRPNINMAINRLKEAAYQKSLLQQYAAEDGYIYDILTYQGQRVDEDTTLMVFLPKTRLFIEANVLESNLHQLQPGKPVEVLIDSAANSPPLKGFVHSIVPATAASFSVLPRNNTDSNWIKVSQRIPVLIEVPNPDNRVFPIGASVEVSVSTLDDQAKIMPQSHQKAVEGISQSVEWQHQFEQQLAAIMQAERVKIDADGYASSYRHCQIE